MTTTKERAPRLTKLEREAKDVMDRIKESQGDYLARFAVVWRKSRTWGMCPSLETLSGAKLAYASGCGYDKESTVLAQAFRFLASNKEDANKIHATGGCGESSTVAALAAIGWKLEKVHNGRTEDGWQLSRMR